MSEVECQIVVLGGGGVGKSALTVQFVHFHFVETYDPTIEDYYRRQVVVDGEVSMVSVLDTAGQEDFSAMRPQYIRQGKAFVLCYSVTEPNSFEELKPIREQILRVKDTDKAPIVLVATKKDMVAARRVSEEAGSTLAKEWGVPFLETSAFTRDNVEEAFFTAVREVRLQDPTRAKRKNSLEKKGISSMIRSPRKQNTLCTIC